MCFPTSGESKYQILQLYLFTIWHTWKVDSSPKITPSRKQLSLSVPYSVSVTNPFPWQRSSGSIACTVWILYTWSFTRRCRNSCTVEWGTCGSLLARRVDFHGLCLKISIIFWTVSALLKIWLLPSYARHYQSLESVPIIVWWTIFLLLASHFHEDNAFAL
jgi:hypothetical protein